MTSTLRKGARATLMAFRSNKYCWLGAGIGIVSMIAFDWIHVFSRLRYPAGYADFFDLPYWLGNESVGFGALLHDGTPGTFLFLLGTILAFLTFLGGIVQALGIALFLVDVSGHIGVVYPSNYSHFQIGFILALASTFIVLTGWGLRIGHGHVRMNTSRIAALSPRLGLFAR